MSNPIDTYRLKRIELLKESLESNNFEVHVAGNTDEARTIVLDEIMPPIGAKSVAWGGSVTFAETKLYDALKKVPDLELFDTSDKNLSKEEKTELRRRSLMADLYISGANAITEEGHLVNLDMIGNRVAAITFGPRHVVVLIGRNKITAGLKEAMDRVKTYAAPVNTMRLGMKTPCAETSKCHDCRSPERICNTWTITEKSFPKGRIKVVLINEDLGY